MVLTCVLRTVMFLVVRCCQVSFNLGNLNILLKICKVFKEWFLPVPLSSTFKQPSRGVNLGLLISKSNIALYHSVSSVVLNACFVEHVWGFFHCFQITYQGLNTLCSLFRVMVTGCRYFQVICAYLCRVESQMLQNMELWLATDTVTKTQYFINVPLVMSWK